MGRGGGGEGRGGGGFESGNRNSGGWGGGGGRGGYRPDSHGQFHGGPSYRHFGPRFYRPGFHHHVIYTGSGGPPNKLAVIALFAVIVMVFCVPAFVLFSRGSGTSVTPSTIAREPLDKQYVVTTGWYTDNLGWIESASQLEAGMEHFFSKTGVQPYLYITDNVNGDTSPSAEELDNYANTLYDTLFEDEGHILVLFYEHGSDGNYRCGYVCGAMAKTVMDQEACDILMDYIDHYYYSDLNETEMFSSAFVKSADRIMTVTKSPLPIILVAIIVLGIVFIAFAWWKKAKRQKNLEAERRERILHADVHSFDQEELGEKEEQYREDESK